MTVRLDTVQFDVWCHEDGSWGAQVQHLQDRGSGLPGDGEWLRDNYDFRGIGPMKNPVITEIECLVSELLSYSVERISGLQLALF